MWRWFRTKADPPKQATTASSTERRRLFLLGTALVARGMEPDEAFRTALHYIEGPGSGQNWMSALSEVDRRATNRPGAIPEHQGKHLSDRPTFFDEVAPLGLMSGEHRRPE
jgi:hypothetical protein